MKKTMMILATVAFAMLARGATTYEVGSATEFADAVKTINSAEGDETEYTISLTSNISGAGTAAISAAGKTVTIKGNGHTLSMANQDYCCIGTNAGTLNLGDAGDSSGLTLTREGGAGSFPLLYVNSGTTVNMYAGTTITNNTSSTNLGGGVAVHGGTFNMYGGIIVGCGVKPAALSSGTGYGGGVAVVDGGYFYMNGGEIKDCFVDSNQNGANSRCPFFFGGGVIVHNGAAFVMDGGTIEGCHVDGTSSAASNDYGMGGGVAISASMKETNDGDAQACLGNLGSAFVMNGGMITNCTANYVGGGVAAYGTSLYGISGSDSYTKVHSIEPGIRLNGGSIEGCSADVTGGGMYFYYITNACLKTTSIVGNHAGDSAGGVYYDTNSALRIGGGACVITNNTAGSSSASNNLTIPSVDASLLIIGDMNDSRIGITDLVKFRGDSEPFTSGFDTNGRVGNPARVFLSDADGYTAVWGGENYDEVIFYNGTIVSVQYNGQAVYPDEDGIYHIEVTNQTYQLTIGKEADGEIEISLKGTAGGYWMSNQSRDAVLTNRVYSASGSEITEYVKFTGQTSGYSTYYTAEPNEKVAEPEFGVGEDDDIAGGKVTVKGTVPGLVYRLNGSDTLNGTYGECAKAEATGETVTLNAGEKKLSGTSGFYKASVDIR